LINIENVQNLVRMAYLPHASDAFGQQGASAITKLLDAVKLIYQRFPPESLRGTLTVLIGMSTQPATPMISAWGGPTIFQLYEELGIALAGADSGLHCLIELVQDGTFRFLQLGTDINLRQ